MRMRREPATASGLTLVEVLVALAIVAIAVVALTMTQATSLRLSRDSVEASNATQVANEEMELLTQKVLDEYEFYQDCPGGDDCTQSYDRQAYAVSYEIARGSGYEYESLIKLRVVVDGPSNAELEAYVSCMDISPPPTVAHPGLCVSP